ncbi:curli assembly protein CsgF [Paenalcaligenes niemegkensis]|uniref:curli assembly protein CsgF n=1 Tax=Paenalcaligenes niemegkensis TaxID=2895469 RepID=UPI001EE83A54|nr:curli assembly protein CsgF [Paenalcaligenes niemegkensis]MCQ9616450.1 curli assembly protein CsgF [Paenalcaligenes niemegkensis]
MNVQTTRCAVTALTLSLALASATAMASPLVYTPVNPSFGGDPLNGNWLLNSAQLTNKHKDPDLDDRFGYQERSPSRILMTSWSGPCLADWHQQQALNSLMPMAGLCPARLKPETLSWMSWIWGRNAIHHHTRQGHRCNNYF